MCRPASQQLFIWPSFIIVTNERRYNAFTDKQLIHRQTHRYSLVQIRPLSIPHHNKQATYTTMANRRWHIRNYRWHIINYRWQIINCGHLNPKQPVSWLRSSTGVVSVAWIPSSCHCAEDIHSLLHVHFGSRPLPAVQILTH